MERIAIYLCTLLCFFSNIQKSLGTEFKSGERVTVDQRVDGDLYVATGELFIRAPIEGDLIACGGKISVTDSVMQDLTICGGELDIDGFIGDDIRTAGGRINLSGQVSGDVVIFGGDIDIQEEAVIFGDLIVYGGQVNIRGRIKGIIKSAGGRIYFEGVAESAVELEGGEVELNGDVYGISTLAAEELKIGESARFFEQVDYWCDQGELEFGASLVNTSARFNPDLREMNGDSNLFGRSMIILIILYGLSILFILILLNFFFVGVFTDAAHTVHKDPTSTLAYGMAFILGLPIVILILFVTLFGIPVGLLLLACYIFSWIFGLSIASVIFARSMKIKYKYDHWNTWMMVLVSALTFMVLKLISMVPFIGWLIYLLVIAVAFGSILFNIIQKMRSKQVSETS